MNNSEEMENLAYAELHKRWKEAVLTTEELQKESGIESF